jgi:hypothetical protein
MQLEARVTAHLTAILAPRLRLSGGSTTLKLDPGT